jgi:hypothetical protein
MECRLLIYVRLTSSVPYFSHRLSEHCAKHDWCPNEGAWKVRILAQRKVQARLSYPKI